MSQRPQDSRPFDAWKRSGGDGAVERNRRARFVVEVVSDPHQFPTPREARMALMEALTELARAFGVEPPDDIDKAFGMAS